MPNTLGYVHFSQNLHAHKRKVIQVHFSSLLLSQKGIL